MEAGHFMKEEPKQEHIEEQLNMQRNTLNPDSIFDYFSIRVNSCLFVVKYG